LSAITCSGAQTPKQRGPEDVTSQLGHVLLNYGLFQVGWFACVWGAASGRPWLGPIAVLGVILVHLARAVKPGREAVLLALCFLIGLIFDSVLLATGWVGYPNGEWVRGLAPYWLISMWVLFGTTLNVSMRWLRGRFWLIFVFGLIGGPASYLAGEALGAMDLLRPTAALLLLAAGWGLTLPLLFSLAVRLDGWAPVRAPEFIRSSWRDAGASGHV